MNIEPLDRAKKRQVGARVPPHDLAAEAALLGACLIPSNNGQRSFPSLGITLGVGEGLHSPDFYSPAHGNIWQACVDLVAAGSVPDPITVAHALHADGLLEASGGPATLVELQNACPAITNAGRYAGIVKQMSTLRFLISIAADIADLGYSMPEKPSMAVVATINKLESWAQATATHVDPLVTDLEAIMDGVEPILPKLGLRDDSATALLYAPGINWLSGEPGHGKSLLGLWWCVQEMRKGRYVVYLDWEGTAQGVVSRMVEMGITKDELRLMKYVRRSDPWDAVSLSHLRKLAEDAKPSLVVFDAVAGAMEAEGLDPESNPDTEKWVAGLPIWLTKATECGVLCIDHVSKDKEKRGRWPIGAVRKLGRADVAYGLDMRQPAGVGITSGGRLLVHKDRYGSLAQHQQGFNVAEVAIHSQPTDNGSHSLYVFLSTPQPRMDDMRPDPVMDGYERPPTSAGQWTPTWYMEQVSKLLEAAGEEGLTEARMRAVLGKNANRIAQACEALARSRHIWRSKPRTPWILQTPYRAPATTIPASFYEHEVGNDDYSTPPPDEADSIGLF